MFDRIFLWSYLILSFCFFDDPVDVDNLISGSSAFSKPTFMYCWSLVWRILSIILLVCAAAAVISVVSNSVRPHGLQPSRLLCPWDFPGKNTGVGCHCLLHASMWDECSYVVVWTFFGIALLWENWPFPVFILKNVTTAEFSKFAGILSAALSQHHL